MELRRRLADRLDVECEGNSNFKNALSENVYDWVVPFSEKMSLREEQLQGCITTLA